MDDAATQPRHRWRFENAEFDEVLGELRIDGQLVPVEPRPLRVLAELLRHADTVLTKEQLLASVWQGRPTVDHVLPSAVNRLRRALGPQASVCIVTLPKQGYRFVGAVQSSLAERAHASGALATCSAPVAQPETAVAAGWGPQAPLTVTPAAPAAMPAALHEPQQPTMQGVDTPADLPPSTWQWSAAAAVLATLTLLLVIALAFMTGHAA